MVEGGEPRLPEPLHHRQHRAVDEAELREREGESPVELTLRLLEDVTGEANALAQSDLTRPSCTCSDVRGCPQCFHRADELVGATVRDSQSRVWKVEDVGEKDGFPTIGGERYWDRPDEVEVLHEAA